MTGVMEALKQKPSVAPIPTVRPLLPNFTSMTLLSLPVFIETLIDFTIGGTR